MPATATAKRDSQTAKRGVFGWQGIRFTLPQDWNITAIPADRFSGYLKIDSPGTMFVQIKWHQPGMTKAKTIGDLLLRAYRQWRKTTAEVPPPDLRAMLDSFLKETGKQARKAHTSFDCKVRPEVKEAGGERTSLPFSWSGAGHGQGKVWHCAHCGRVVIAQVVGQAKDNIGAVASELFGSFQDHSLDGWTTWALYDMVAQAPSDFEVRAQKLMSGYLKLDLSRRGGERIVLERWGLANVARKKFTLAEWFEQTCRISDYKPDVKEARIHGHEGHLAEGRTREFVARIRALRDAGLSFRPATRYDACVWECPETNKIHAIQVHRNLRSTGLLNDVIERYVCH